MSEGLRILKRVSGFLAFVSLGAFLQISQWQNPPRTDDIQFHRAAEKWFLNGPVKDGLWHTPLYLEGLRVWQSFTGVASPDAPWRTRSFGLFCALLSLGILLWGVRKSAAIHTLSNSPLIITALLLFHPYFVQGSLLHDIDNTLLIPFLLIWVVRFEDWFSAPVPLWRKTIELSGWLSVCLMIKEITPFLLIPLWIIWALWKSDQRLRFFFHAILGSVLGVILFAGLLWVWSRSNGFAWLEPLELTFFKAGPRMEASGFSAWKAWGVSRFLFLSYLPLLWFSFPVLSNMFWSLRDRGGDNGIRFRPLPLSIGLAALCMAAYGYLVQAAFYFPKYTVGVWPLLLLGFANKIPYSYSEILPKLREFRVLLGLATCMISGFWIGLDPLLIIDARKDLRWETLTQHALSIIIPCIVIYFGAWFRQPSRLVASSLGIIFSVTLLFFSSLSHSLREDFGTNYNYGERGFEETIQNVRNIVTQKEGEKVFTMAVDLGWVLRKYSEVEQDPIAALRRIESGRYKAVVSRTFDAYSIRNFPELLTLVQSKFRCHKVVNAERGRFEWWWEPDDGNCDFTVP